MGFDVASIVEKAIEGIAGSASDIIKDFKPTPDKVLEYEAKGKELQNQIEQAKIKLTTDLEAEYTKQMQTVNETMQAEDKSEHWITYSWRPAIGFTFCIILINDYVLYPYLHQYGAVLLEIPQTVWITISSILGVSAIGRSLEKIQALK